MTATVNVNSKDVEVHLDTGNSTMLFGDRSSAKKLGLTLEDVSHKEIPMNLQDSTTTVKWECAGVPVKALGRERFGTFTLAPEEFSDMTVLGMEFLLGSVFRFSADGTFDWTIPDPTRGLAGRSSEAERFAPPLSRGFAQFRF